jgi:glyceraldehyde-3-phosphate dehydrogenase (NADP+)
MYDLKIYASGKFIDSTHPFEVRNPYNNDLIGKTYQGNYDQLNEAIEKALQASDQLKKLPSFKRYNILLQIAHEMQQNREELTRIICLESAKPWRYALGEVNRAIQTFTIAAEESKRLPHEYIDLDWTEPAVNREGLVRYFPIGLVAGISPFNFPLNLAVHKIAPAIASGCPIILKPPSNAPMSTLNLARIIDKTDLPKGAVSVIPMDRETGNHLVTDERFKLLSFTGSDKVGWKMKKEAGKKKVVLELGGNAGVIITGSADMDHAVKRCLIGGYAYSGQVCIHAQRIYLHQSVFDQFSQKFINGVEKLKVGDPMDKDTDISAMIDEVNAKRVEEWVNEAVDNGAKILTGGKRAGTFYAPTVLTDTNENMKVCALEIFGPVVSIEPYNNLEEAIQRMNSGKYGLQAGIFTRNIDEMDLAFAELDVGGVILNDAPTFRVDHMPYGGVKNSGLGREGVKYSIMDMMEAKILVKNKK